MYKRLLYKSSNQSYMKTNMTFRSGTLFLSVLLQFSYLLLFSFSAKAQTATNSTKENRIEEERFITINGIEQWVTIKGDRSKPAILFLHGGPGSPISPYSDNLYGSFEKDFIIIQWDQRGAGRTFGKNAPSEINLEYFKENPLTADQIINDGIVLSEYLTKYLGKQKLTLFGTSWGSVPGVAMASKRPDLFTAYVGHSQIVTPKSNALKTFQKVSDMVQKANDQESAEILKTIGAPPYAQAKTVGRFFRVLKKYERQRATPAPDSWFVPAPAYDNDTDRLNSENGDDYSFLNYAGDSKLGIAAMSATIDNRTNYTNFRIPVYFIQGEEDILTPAEDTQEYFARIKAPAKKYIPLAKTAHGFNQAVIEAQYKLFKEINR